MIVPESMPSRRSTKMAGTLLQDDAQTVARLDSVACLLEWTRSLPAPSRKRFWNALAECSNAEQQAIVALLSVVKDHRAKSIERQRALTKIADTLFRKPDAEDNDLGQESTASERNSQQAAFVQRLRELMEAKRISQHELAERVGCSQPAISQMLNRESRPQKKTILKLAEALNVQPRELWPDIDVADMLDAVASFQQDEYVMTEAEARALADTSKKNRPRIQGKSLPKRS